MNDSLLEKGKSKYRHGYIHEQVTFEIHPVGFPAFNPNLADQFPAGE